MVRTFFLLLGMSLSPFVQEFAGSDNSERIKAKLRSQSIIPDIPGDQVFTSAGHRQFYKDIVVFIPHQVWGFIPVLQCEIEARGSVIENIF
jgi:hypothetical protein